ncbi:MAG: sulfite exporter TauE/SafE family protein [Patescibacteria group bacterium]
MDLFAIFVTGLFAGGLTCLAVQGGLLASSISTQNEEGDHVISILSFLGARLIAYTILGVILGTLGSAFQFSLTARSALQILAVIFMVGTALNLLDVHPVFRYFVIQPPRFLARIIKNQSRSKSVFGPALLGLFTVLIPCGATQAMMAYAISTGAAWNGALVMFTFILGTTPLFFALGYVTRKMSGSGKLNFNKIAAVAIFLVALYNLNGALALMGSPYTIETLLSTNNVQESGGEVVTEATIFFDRAGYVTEPRTVNVKAGTEVKLKLVNKNGAGCIQAFTIPAFGIQKIVPVGKSEEITITPDSPGTIAFMCSMGMYRGEINVI